MLKVTPPRVSRQLLTRQALAAGRPWLRETPILLLQAPAGFGKTSLLAQWRLDLIARGTAVGWFACQPHDDGARLLQGLTLALRGGAGWPGFGQALLEDLLGSTREQPLEGLTRWLAELAHLATNVVLVIDEADRLPTSTRELLAYLLHNQPPNLRCIVAARSDCDLGLGDLIAYGQARTLGPAELRFSLEETLALMRLLASGEADLDLAAQLHELCEGWPLGLQLLLAPAAAGADLRSLRERHDDFGTGQSPQRERLLELLLRQLSSEDLRLLEDGSIVDHLHPALCRRLSGAEDAPARLARLARDTPLLSQAEQGEWLRLHALAREQLREHVQQRPVAERAALHARAAAWFLEQGQLEAAARHAWQAGERTQALDLAERSLYEALTQRGRQGEVREWLDRLPPEALEQRPRLQLAAAWSLATSERHAEAGERVERLLAGGGADAALRCECALVLGSAAIFADDPDRFLALHDPWVEKPPLSDPMLLAVHANRNAFRALLLGQPAAARQSLPSGGGQGLRYVGFWADLIQGLSYVWEGQVRLAEAQLQPSLARAESQLGRRSPFACMQAVLLASCLWEQGRPEEAEALLAHRLDVIERSGLPDIVMLAYRTLARMASAAGVEHRALELLAALGAVGAARGLPRLIIVSLAEQLRLHASHYRGETCKVLLEQLEATVREHERTCGPIWQRGVRMQLALARGHAALAAREWRAAIGALEQAAGGAQTLHLQRFRIEALGLRAFALDRCSERDALPLMQEVLGLAASLGLQRVFSDAHPDLGNWASQANPPEAVAVLRPSATPPAGATPAPARAGAANVTALTPKEREVLELLGRNLSNKEVALALQVGEETVKWHVKNLFSKLDAGTRKQAVARARILGILPPLV